LQLWGQAKDASKAKDWSPAETSGPDEEQTGSEATPTDKVSQKPKPTDHLPDDHGSAEGEAHKPGLGDTSPTAAADVSTGPGAEEDVTNENGDIGYDGSGWYHTGIDTVKENKTWFAGGGGLFLLAIAAGGVFFLFRARRKRQMMQELSAERGEYAPVAEEVPMGLLGRRNNDGGKKDMYDDAFAENEMPEDDDFDTRDGAPLKYHDDFLEDEEGEDDSPKRSTPAYRDDREGKSPSPGATGFSGQTSSSSSWQEADPLT
jgi:kexin